MSRRVRIRTLVLGLALLAMLGVAFVPRTIVTAQGGEQLPPGVTWDEVNAVARQMYCDVCEGIPLDECESVACRNWRQEIARLISEGYTEDEIIDHFVERYGEDVASLPRSSSDRFLAFAVPALLVVLIGVLGAFQMRRLRQRGQQAGQVVRRSAQQAQARPVPDDVDAAYLERLDRELEGLES